MVVGHAAEMIEALVGLGCSWLAAISGAEGGGDALGIGRMILHQPGGHGQPTRGGEFAVKQREYLRRNSRFVAAFTTGFAAGPIENLQHRIAERANAKGVNRSSISLGSRS